MAKNKKDKVKVKPYIIDGVNIDVDQVADLKSIEEIQEKGFFDHFNAGAKTRAEEKLLKKIQGIADDETPAPENLAGKAEIMGLDKRTAPVKTVAGTGAATGTGGKPSIDKPGT